MRTKFTIFLLMYAISILGIQAQGIYHGDLTLTSQSQVAAFNYSRITGRLTISGSDITDLSPLQILTFVSALSITNNTQLTAITGLSGLQIILSSIVISDNPVLQNIDGLAYLQQDAIDNLTIQNNLALQHINAFASVRTITGELIIADNPALQSFYGLINITSVGASSTDTHIAITGNSSLPDLNGFGGLRTITGNYPVVEIIDNASLQNINGLSSLNTLSGTETQLVIRKNPSLLNVNGLSALVTLGRTYTNSIDISENNALQDISGISNLNIIFPPTAFHLTVSKNPVLTDCSPIYPLMIKYGLDYVTPETFTIFDNGSGCTIQDILANGQLALSNFSLYDIRTGTKAPRDFFGNSGYAEIMDPLYPYWILHISSNPQQVGSVVFTVDNTTNVIDNEAPYEYDFQSLAPGLHFIEANVYSLPDGAGVKGTGRRCSFAISASGHVYEYDVVDLSGNVIKTLSEGDTINILDPAYQAFSIRASLYPDPVNNVKFYLNNVFYSTDTVTQYALNGDENGQFLPWTPTPGAYALQAIPYGRTALTEVAGTGILVNFTIISKPLHAVTGFNLVGGNGAVIRPLQEGDRLNLNEPALRNFSVVANTTGPVGSVKFLLDGHLFRVENNVPYTLTGDVNGIPNQWRPRLGSHSIAAVPYLGADGNGQAGEQQTVSFSVVRGPVASDYSLDDASGATISLYPVPIQDNLSMEIKNLPQAELTIVIRNNQGQVVYSGRYNADQQSVSINTSALPSGIYVVQLLGAGNFEKAIRVTK
jgi:hypothetical protein